MPICPEKWPFERENRAKCINAHPRAHGKARLVEQAFSIRKYSIFLCFLGTGLKRSRGCRFAFRPDDMHSGLRNPEPTLGESSILVTGRSDPRNRRSAGSHPLDTLPTRRPSTDQTFYGFSFLLPRFSSRLPAEVICLPVPQTTL